MSTLGGGSSKVLGRPQRRSTDGPCFTVKHYASSVTYLVEGLVDKNKVMVSTDTEMSRFT